uniref:Ribonuclease H-like domain-containing protein n=1 Tax=Tanacetum cinerariifolium TaxID=118510 RepID=A0A6L2N2Q0_TANCI|nr:ribonuclease H-like domain-containing protein [Tanacetum cinerariifolium]
MRYMEMRKGLANKGGDKASDLGSKGLLQVTILNTIDHLGKFDGKADEGFFVGYTLNSKAFRVFNSRIRIVEENLHIRFSESTPNVVGSRLDWLFDIEALIRTMNYELIVVDPKSSHDGGSKPSSDDGKKVDEDPRKEAECKDQKKEDNVNSTNNVNTVSLTVNAAGTNEDNELPFNPNMPTLEDVSIFNFLNDDEDDDFVVYEMDVKSAFLYGKIKEEVYLCQPPGFEDQDFLDRVFKIEKALYRLHQAPKAWFTEVKTASTPMETQKPLLKDEGGKEVDVHMYRLTFCMRAKKRVRLMMEKLFGMELELRLLFWSTAMAKTINGEVQLHAKVPQPSGSTDNVADEVVHKELGDSLVRATTIASSLKVEQDSARVESSDEESLGEDASKQGRRIDAIDQDEDITLVNVQDDAEMFNVDDLGGEEVFIIEQEVFSTTATTEELTLGQALKALKTLKPKVKGIVIQEQEKPGKSTTTTAAISKQQSQDKGKGIMIKEPVKPKKRLN